MLLLACRAPIPRSRAAWLVPASALFVLAWRLTLAQAEHAPALTPVELTVVGGPALNPNSQGRASPVVVRIFELGATQIFESTEFAALFEHAEEALKADLLKQEEFVLHPGEIQQHNRDLGPQVRALGVVAAFRDLGQSVWRLTVLSKPGRRQFLLIGVDGTTIRLVPIDRTTAP